MLRYFFFCFAPHPLIFFGLKFSVSKKSVITQITRPKVNRKNNINSAKCTSN